MSAHPATHRIIRAELIGSDICTALGLTVRSHAPALAMCRKLLAAGYDPRCELHVYRDATLTLSIRSIAAGAALDVRDDNRGAPRFARYRPGPAERARIACGEAPPIAPIDCLPCGGVRMMSRVHGWGEAAA